MPVKNLVIIILIHSKTNFQNISVKLLCCIAKESDILKISRHTVNAMILMPQIFDVIANEN